jgi:hypothetical protein
MKRRVQKRKELKVIKQYEPLFQNMFGSVIQIVGDFNPTEYRTQEAKIKSTLEKQLEETSNSEQFGEAFLKLFSTLNLKSLVTSLQKTIKKEIKEHSENDVRFAELHRLVNDAESKCPNIACVLFFQSNPLELLSKSFEPYDLIQKVEEENGEHANRNIIRIYREVAELLYDDYLKALYGFVQILEGKKIIKLSNTFGNLTSQLPDRLEKLGYKNLVDSDAGWMRNATCHGRWAYKPENGKAILWDLNKSEKEFSHEELLEKALNMYAMVVNNYLSLILIYLKNKICSKEWFSILSYIQKNWSGIVNEDKVKSENIKKMIEGEISHFREFTFK